jgi:hypothetical protein
MLSHRIHNPRVGGSSPPPATNKITLENDPIQKYHGMEVRAFLRQLRQAANGAAVN